MRSLWSLDRDLAYARHYPAVSWSASFSRDAARVGAWHAANGDPEWARRRGRVLSLVADADRLAALADLVGVGSLPGPERMVLLTGRLAAGGGPAAELAVAPTTPCAPRRRGPRWSTRSWRSTTAAWRSSRRGVLASLIEEVDWGPIVRARDETGSAGRRRRRGRGATSCWPTWTPWNRAGGCHEPVGRGGVHVGPGPARPAARRPRTCAGVGWDEYVTARAPTRARTATVSSSRSTATLRSSRCSRAPRGSSPQRTRVRFGGTPLQHPRRRVVAGSGLQRAWGPAGRRTARPRRRAGRRRPGPR